MRDRHPVLENLVFGLAALLAAILAYYAYARFAGGRPGPGMPGGPGSSAESGAASSAPQLDDDGGGVPFSGGGSVPTVRFSTPKKRAKK